MELLTEFLQDKPLDHEPTEDVLRRVERLGTLTLDDLWEEEWLLTEL